MWLYILYCKSLPSIFLLNDSFKLKILLYFSLHNHQTDRGSLTIPVSCFLSISCVMYWKDDSNNKWLHIWSEDALPCFTFGSTVWIDSSSFMIWECCCKSHLVISPVQSFIDPLLSADDLTALPTALLTAVLHRKYWTSEQNSFPLQQRQSPINELKLPHWSTVKLAVKAENSHNSC